jgi:hypothetical protein
MRLRQRPARCPRREGAGRDNRQGSRASGTRRAAQGPATQQRAAECRSVHAANGVQQDGGCGGTGRDCVLGEHGDWRAHALGSGADEPGQRGAGAVRQVGQQLLAAGGGRAGGARASDGGRSGPRRSTARRSGRRCRARLARSLRRCRATRRTTRCNRHGADEPGQPHGADPAWAGAVRRVGHRGVGAELRAVRLDRHQVHHPFVSCFEWLLFVWSLSTTKMLLR